MEGEMALGQLMYKGLLQKHDTFTAISSFLLTSLS